MDILILSRIQFGATLSFHIMFPTIRIALGWVLLFFKLRFCTTSNQKWMDAYMFWVKVFALSFALGALLIPVQIVVSDMHGLNTLEHQPQKVAAIEGH